jgi:hypothetical protein
MSLRSKKWIKIKVICLSQKHQKTISQQIGVLFKTELISWDSLLLPR